MISSSIFILHKLYKFHPYKIQVHRKFDNQDRPIEFCEILFTRINAKRWIFKYIYFSDEFAFIWKEVTAELFNLALLEQTLQITVSDYAFPVK